MGRAPGTKDAVDAGSWPASDAMATGKASAGLEEPQDAPHGHGGPSREHGWGLAMLAFSTLGIIYGDIGTSPLYSYQSVFSSDTNTAPTPDTVLSAASLFFWTLTLIVLVKYVGIVMRFDDNGEGGTFALYSLICRAAGFTPYGPAQPEELHGPHGAGAGAAAGGAARCGRRGGHGSSSRPWWGLTTPAGDPLRRLYARSRTAQVALLLTVMMATAMVVGDGVLTPSISVLSAISGLKVAAPGIKQGEVVGVTIVVLVLLFSVQYMGTAKISAVFAPIIAVWLLFNAGIGLASLSSCGWGIWKAVSPHYAIYAFTGPDGFVAGWKLLAGVMLAITGAEAMYADLGHFNARAVSLSFLGLVYPCLVITYMGQASFVTAHPEAYTDPFWLSVPKGAFWPMLIVATAATVVASQALISGVFSIMRQAMNLGVFPTMKVTHTDSMAEGQIYIRSINYCLMLGCIAVVAGFQDTTALGHAYGVAVMSVMFMTTILSGIVMLVCFSVNPLLVALFLVVFVPLEGLFLSSNIIKIPEGGWVAIMIAALVAAINIVWWYGSGAKQNWYKAQAAKNRGLLAQLPLGDLAEDGPGGEGGAAATGAAALAAAGSGGAAMAAVAQRRRGSGPGVLPASLQPAESADLASVSADGGAGAGAGEGGAFAAAARLHACSFHAPGVWGGSRGPRDVVLFRNKPLTRLPGIGIVYTQVTRGLPAVLEHMLINLPVLHDVTVLLTLRVITRPYASQGERFLVRRSSQLSGLFRVIVRYGYMEAVDHGPAFVKQLVTCLVRFVAGENSNAASASSDGHGGKAGRPGGATPGAVAIEVPEVGEGGGGGAGGTGAAPRGLERWSRIPANPADGAMLDEVMATTGPNLAARSFTRAVSVSPTTSLDAATAAALSSGLASARSSGGALLGRESINRHQYSRQRSAAAAVAAHSGGAASGGGGGDGSGGRGGAAATGGGHLALSIPCAVPSDRALTFPAGGNAAAGAGAGAAAAAASDDDGTASSGSGGRPPLTPAQLRDVELLLSCYRHRAVYIMGRSQLAAASAVSATAAGAKGEEQQEKRQRRRGCGCGALGVAAAHGRQLAKGVVTGAYRFLANNTHPSSQAWELPDDQLMLVSMVVRV